MIVESLTPSPGIREQYRPELRSRRLADPQFVDQQAEFLSKAARAVEGIRQRREPRFCPQRSLDGVAGGEPGMQRLAPEHPQQSRGP